MGKPSPSPDALFVNARALTMDARLPEAQAVAVGGGFVTWVGSNREAESLKRPGVRFVDCGGGTLTPGFHDAHIHMMAYAAAALAVDCRPPGISSIASLKRAIAERAARTPEGEWIRAFGYEESALSERRHPTRRDLDAAAPRHPVRLNHRSGHACVLNSLAMERVGIGMSFPELGDATIDRELDTAEPSGLMFEMEDYLDRKIPPLPDSDMERALRQASESLLGYGVTSVQDATHTNSPDRWDFFAGLRDSMNAAPRMTLMPGYARLRDFTERGLAFGRGDSRLRVGHAKIMATASSGRQSPDEYELRRIVAECAELGFPVAVHAVEASVTLSAARALSNHPAPGYRHRIEHCSECPPEALDAVARSSADVVTQPGFVYESGDRYLREVDEAMRPYLYRMRSLAERGVRLAFGSDAPVVEPNPMRGIYAAVTRRTESGRVLGAGERVSLTDALRAYTLGAAQAAGLEREVGTLAPGKLADMTLFQEDLASLEPERLPDIRPAMTVLGGKIVFE